MMKKRVINDAELFTKRDEGEATIGVPKSLDMFGPDIAMALCVEPSLDGRVIVGDEIKFEQMENKIVGLMLPHHAFYNVSEPCLMVQNYTQTPDTELGKKALELIEVVSKRHHQQVIEKLQKIGCDALTGRNLFALRGSWELGNRDINAVDDSAKAYMLDTYTISHMGRGGGSVLEDGML
ncbi:hypothetical protein, partial [Gluconobacter sp. P1D12_c]|uniref:hypothetical protein n=5 Tax=Gluconobacter sp. P1D12_c TaxID=2762614 RepID=UPI001C058B19